MAKYLHTPDDYFRSSRTGDEEPVTLTPTEARQGSRSRATLYMLIGGLILVAIAWWASEYYGRSIAPPTPDQTTTSSVGKNPAADGKMIDDNQPKNEPVQTAPAIRDSTKM